MPESRAGLRGSICPREFGRPYGAWSDSLFGVPRVASAAADFTLGYFLRLPTGARVELIRTAIPPLHLPFHRFICDCAASVAISGLGTRYWCESLWSEGPAALVFFGDEEAEVAEVLAGGAGYYGVAQGGEHGTGVEVG